MCSSSEKYLNSYPWDHFQREMAVRFSMMIYKDLTFLNKNRY